MSAGLKRRDVVRGGLLGAAALAMPARALAEPLGEAFDQAFASSPPPIVPATVDPNPAYERKVLEIAAREVARAGNSIWRRDIAGIADFGRPSSVPRFHF